jgi:hypothetical protein
MMNARLLAWCAALGLAAPTMADTQKVVANPEYEASGLHRFWLGKGYRDLWTTPVELEVHGNLELRLRAIDQMPVVPGRLWVVGLADFGRVWREGEDSDDWHPSYGGGIAFEVAGAPLTFWTGAAKADGENGVRIYFLSGFGF